ncbi:hypothetical protein UFOVP399_17 [uncultured Caudovirales phage]|uniref:Uncharacterized protein n=1 Tax=uncultured Caudovirales phage TaxID=2100421 RepID=A0A6J5M3W0_9CAUD|nr:hypothetical protein UFOVP399_17 [uncultured Caudovirales phage]
MSKREAPAMDKAIEAAALGATAGFGLALWGLLSANQLSAAVLHWKYTAARDTNYVERQYLQGASCVQYRYESGERDDFAWCQYACESKYADEMAEAACKAGASLAARAALSAIEVE